jgi:transcriptional regulator with XRE-family HTH domain
MNITAQIREMIDMDPEGVNAISRRYGLAKNTVSAIRRGAISPSPEFAVQYIADKGWRWKIRHLAFRGTPEDMLRRHLQADPEAVETLRQSGEIDNRTVMSVLSGKRPTKIATIDKIADILGLRFIVVEQEAVA